MRLLFINPNATESMTATIVAAARAAAPTGVEIVARTNHAGPPAIQGEADGAAALPGLLAEVAAASDAFDAIVIACFDEFRRPKELHQSRECLDHVVGLALPNCEDLPAVRLLVLRACARRGHCFGRTSPPRTPREFRRGGQTAARMSVPETAVHKK